MQGQMDFAKDLTSPFDSMMSAYKLSQESAARQALTQQALLENEKKKLDLNQEISNKEYLNAFNNIKNPSGNDYAELITRVPSISQAIKSSWDIVGEGRKEAKTKELIEVSQALDLGGKDTTLAKEIIQKQIDAYNNSGLTSEAKEHEGILSALETDPKMANIAINSSLVSILGPEKYAQYKKLPSDIRLNEEKALSEVTDRDYKNKMAQLKAIEVRLSKETNALSRQKLGLDAQKIRADLQEKSTEIQTKNNNATELYSEIDTIVTELLSPAFANKVKSATGGSYLSSFIPGSGSADAAARIERLENLLALKDLDKLKGPLSDKDVMFVKGINANLKRSQSEEQFRKELERIRKKTKTKLVNVVEVDY